MNFRSRTEERPMRSMTLCNIPFRGGTGSETTMEGVRNCGITGCRFAMKDQKLALSTATTPKKLPSRSKIVNKLLQVTSSNPLVTL